MNDTPPAPEQVAQPAADPAAGKDTPQPVDWLGEIRSLAVMLLAVLAFHSFIAKPVSYTHLTLPTNREV